MASATVIPGLQRGATAELEEADGPLTSIFFIALGPTMGNFYPVDFSVLHGESTLICRVI